VRGDSDTLASEWSCVSPALVQGNVHGHKNHSRDALAQNPKRRWTHTPSAQVSAAKDRTHHRRLTPYALSGLAPRPQIENRMHGGPTWVSSQDVLACASQASGDPGEPGRSGDAVRTASALGRPPLAAPSWV